MLKLKRSSKADLFLNVLIILFALFSVLPVYWLLTSAFKLSGDTVAIPPQWFPADPTLINFKNIFVNNNAGRWMFNSVLFASVSTFGIIVISSLTSYTLSKLRIPFKRVITAFIVAALMLPKEVYLLPLYQLMVDFGWLGTWVPFVVPDLAMPFGVFLLKQFYDSIPNEIYESASMDGCNDFRFFYTFGLPLTKPGIGALTIIAFIRVWNNFLWQFVMASGNRELYTLPVGVAALFEAGDVVDFGLKYAGAAVSAIPLLLIFFLFQRFFTQGIAAGAVKG